MRQVDVSSLSQLLYALTSYSGMIFDVTNINNIENINNKITGLIVVEDVYIWQ